MGFLRFSTGGGAVFSPSIAPVITNALPLAWSDPATWGGQVPGPRDVVRVPSGRTLLVDRDIDVAALEISGTVLFAPQDVKVQAAGILVTGPGALRAGDAEQPFRHKLTITLSGSPERELIDGLGSKFLAALDGGAIELHGPRRASWVVLGDSVTPGAIVIRLAEPVDWSAGDKIALASGGVDLPLVEERTVFGVTPDGLRVTLDTPVRHGHLGRNARQKTTLPGSIAKVALLSRSIVVEGDNNSTRSGYGAHCLIAAQAPGELNGEPSAASGSVGCFIGVEFRRMGQFNRNGRYPLHWLGNRNTGGNVLSDCVIHQSFQRGVVVSGTRGVRLHGNVVYKPLGHGFIVDQTEDPSAILTTNVTIRPRRVRFADAAMRDLYERRPRSVWFANADMGNNNQAGAAGSANETNGASGAS